MSIINMLFYILVGLVLGASANISSGAGAITLTEVEQKLATLEKELASLKQKQSNSEKKFVKVQNELEYGGKRYQTLQYTNSARNAWLGCPDSNGTCDLRTCPSNNNNYRYFDSRCWGENFQIIGEGTIHNPIKSGQRIRLRYLREHNTWMSCYPQTYCDKRTCPGTTAQASDFSRCWGEVFTIYARGKRNGQIIHDGDVVMIYYIADGNDGRYVSIQGQYEGDDTSLSFCPGVVPPAYLSYGICSKNAFRIFRKP